MSSAPEKVPIMTRFDRRLEKHGLSFGDALNILLFALTIASLYLAYQGVRLARVTLEDARKQATQAAKDQDAQFQKQMEQLKAASDAMRETSALMSSQGNILRDLQGISRQQLKDMNVAEARVEKQEKARPAPSIRGSCNTLFFLEASERDFRLDPITRAGRLYANSAHLRPGQPGELECSVMIANEGAAELSNVTLEAQVWGMSKGEVALITDINGIENHDIAGRLMAGLNLPPKSISNRPFTADFTIRFGTCTDFKIILTLYADNLDTLTTVTKVTLR